jgi:hypothetical protein
MHDDRVSAALAERLVGRRYVVDEYPSGEDRDRPHRYRVREAPTGRRIRTLTEYTPTP